MPKHKIKAKLYSNSLTETHDLIARVHTEKSLNIKDIAKSATQRGGAEVSADEMEHIVELFLKEMHYLLSDGFSVNTGWFLAAPKIKGAFAAPTEKFDPAKHTFLFEMRQGLQMRKGIPDIEINITGTADVSAEITQVKDVKSGSANDLITPNRNLRIIGNRIKIAGENENNGVWFINDQTGEHKKVDISDIVSNKPSELIVIVPDLLAGMYRLEVTTQYSKNAMLKEPRTAAFEKVLTVVQGI